MRLIRFIRRIPGLIVIAMIRIYQFTLSPLIGQNCRFTPTCSQYMIQAIEKYGAVRGVFQGTKRIMRCHPWNAGGHDPP